MESLKLQSYRKLSSLPNFSALEKDPKYKYYLSTFDKEKEILENELAKIRALRKFVNEIGDERYVKNFLMENPVPRRFYYLEFENLIKEVHLCSWELLKGNVLDIFQALEKLVKKRKKLTRSKYEILHRASTISDSHDIIDFVFEVEDGGYKQEIDFDSDSESDNEFEENLKVSPTPFCICFDFL